MKVFLIAGEASGDRLGAALMVGLKQLRPDVEFCGVGGPLMQAEGLDSLFPMDELSVFGIAEILPKYRALKARIAQCAREVLHTKPDVLITIDSPDFCLRVARLVKESSTIRTVHYVAPSVWAWRAGRAAKMARYVDHVLALLPFEPPYMKEAGMACDFVGHPVVAEPIITKNEIAAFRAQYSLGEAPILLVLPGSRRSEVKRLAPVFGEALSILCAKHPELKVIVPAARSVADQVREATRNWPIELLILDASQGDIEFAETRKRTAFAAADVALAASGTVSLELAAANTPMVIAYRLQWLTWQIMSRMIRVDTVTLVNLVTKRNVVPEFLGPECRAEPIASALDDLLSARALRSKQLVAMVETMQLLGHGSEAPGHRAARAVLQRMPRKN